MKKIAVLLHGSIQSDYRVVKTVITLAKYYEIDLFFHGQIKDANLHFEGLKNVRSFALNKKAGLWSKILSHSLFCYAHSYMSDEVLNSREKYDFVWANDLPTLLPAVKASKTLHSKVIYDSHEIYVETINQFFLKQQNPIKNTIFIALTKLMRYHGKYMEKKLLRSTSLMFTVNESLKAYFEKTYNYNNIEVLMNLPNQTDVSKKNIFDFKTHFSWPLNSVVVIYQGALNAGRGLNLMIDAFKYLPHNYRLVILGKGTLKNQLIEKVSKNELERRVCFLDAVPLSILIKYTQGADIGLNLLEDFNLSKKLASPNKLFEYIHAGIPVVASDTIENKKVFEKFNIGLLCENTPQNIALRIQETQHSKNQYTQDLTAAKTCYSWENQEANFLKAIANLCPDE